MHPYTLQMVHRELCFLWTFLLEKNEVVGGIPIIAYNCRVEPGNQFFFGGYFL